MARGINKAILIGNLGNDPETRYTQQGNAVTTLSIATTDSWTDRQSGERQERTEWHRVVCFNRLGEVAGQYLRKGSKVFIEGRITTRKWDDKQGQTRYTTEIVANDMQMLDGRSGAGDFAGGGQGGGAAMGAGAPAGGSNQPMPNPQNMNGPSGYDGVDAAPAGGDDFDDDIPF